MIITEDVYGRVTSTKIVSAGTVVTARVLEVLGLHGIKYVNVGANNKASVDSGWVASDITASVKFSEFVNLYQTHITLVKKELGLLMSGNDTDVNVILNVVSDLIETVTTNAQVLNFIRYIEQADDAVFAHCVNVAVLCGLFGSWLKMPRQDRSALIVSGMMHDIGKTRIHPKILYKPGKLTDEEFAEIKKHTVHGYRILEKSNLPNVVKLAALMHHEKLDGSGYPLRITHSDIDLVAMTVAICDVYEAMTADRVYRAKMSPFTVIRQFEQGSFGSLYEGYLFIFLRKIAESFVNNDVILSDGRKGRILHVAPGSNSRPLVQCDDKFVDLAVEKDLQILNVI